MSNKPTATVPTIDEDTIMTEVEPTHTMFTVDAASDTVVHSSEGESRQSIAVAAAAEDYL